MSVCVCVCVYVCVCVCLCGLRGFIVFFSGFVGGQPVCLSRRSNSETSLDFKWVQCFGLLAFNPLPTL